MILLACYAIFLLLDEKASLVKMLDIQDNLVILHYSNFDEKAKDRTVNYVNRFYQIDQKYHWLSKIDEYIKSQDSEETEEKISCSINTICSDCEFCKNYSNCNFYNIFCYKNTTGDYIRNEELQSNVSIYYKSDREINNFCNSRNIELNSVKKSFNIFESPSNTINNILTRSFHCEYYVTNKYYLNHNTDQARINIEIKNQESSEIRFFLILIYKMGQNWRFFRFDDIQLRDGGFSRVLDQISEFQILLDFFSTNISEEISEYLVLSISTENPSENLKLI